MRSVSQLLVVLCIAAAALSVSAQPAASSSTQLPSTLATQGPSRVCSCIAGTYESKECATAAQKYCAGNATADVNFCSAAPRGTLDLALLRSNQTAAAGVSGFLAAMCMPASSSTQMDACACFTVSGRLSHQVLCQDQFGACVSCVITLHGWMLYSRCAAACMQSMHRWSSATARSQDMSPMSSDPLLCVIHPNCPLPSCNFSETFLQAPASGACALAHFKTCPSCSQQLFCV
jgi:hypothetical protein